MVAQASWDSSSSDSSDDKEELCHITRHMALTAHESDDDTSREEENSTDDESSSSEEEVMDKVKQRFLYRIIGFLKNALDKSKSKVKVLKEELRTCRSNICDHGDLGKENEKLKTENVDLRKCLEKFTLGSKNLDMVLNSQRAVYNKAGIGYRPKEVSYIALVGRQGSTSQTTKGKTRQAWVPKKHLQNVNESSFWVPKSEVFYVV